MKLAILFCILAMLFYALEIAVADWKLTSVSPRFLTLCYSLGVAICAAISLLVGNSPIKTPQGYQWFFVALLIGASFIAAVSHFEALHHESGAVMLTMFYCLMPVAASFYMACFKREVPNLRIVLAWIVAAVALYLVSTSKSK